MANQWDEQMLKSCIGLPWNPQGYTREQIMEKFDQGTREKKAASTIVVIPPGSAAAAALKKTSQAAASSSGAEVAAASSAAAAADLAFSSTPKKVIRPALVVSPTVVRPVKRLFDKTPQVKPMPVPEATEAEMKDREPGPAAQKRGLDEGGADQEGGDMTRRDGT